MSNQLRPLDHLVLPVADLTVAEQRYAALGFTVAPRGEHPFGTVNACVYLSDDTFLEPLAVGNADAATTAVESGNVFVSHHTKYQTRAGQEGFSALVLGTLDAAADHERFRAEGISGGDMLRFSRPFIGKDGSSGEATFLLAFAADLRAPDALFFTCERIGVPKVDRAPLTEHANGAARLKRVILVAPEPQLFETLFTKLLDDAAVVPTSSGFKIATATTDIEVLEPKAAATLLGTETWDAFDPTLQLAAVEFAVSDLGATGELLQRKGIASDQRNGIICVAPAPGQGVPFLFSEDGR
ncbi:VOC family protein [Tianweitania sediminis]|uniref:VOC family protein n=1 Tax=Tianweitania sediminis TaxID=1502156 RepID=A0A8J7R4G2_9HYPH|nr:VOC family protein [Tianweitania sediminis]MBP0440983.1 VOC family protein [Tianweitania sediminis]